MEMQSEIDVMIIDDPEEDSGGASRPSGRRARADTEKDRKGDTWQEPIIIKDEQDDDFPSSPARDGRMDDREERMAESSPETNGQGLQGKIPAQYNKQICYSIA
jgi:hypothetical protein